VVVVVVVVVVVAAVVVVVVVVVLLLVLEVAAGAVDGGVVGSSCTAVLGVPASVLDGAEADELAHPASTRQPTRALTRRRWCVVPRIRSSVADGVGVGTAPEVLRPSSDGGPTAALSQ
jgi:hypothetical protein